MYRVNNGEPVYDSKSANWSNLEIEKLVEIWSEPQIQREMDSTYRNFFVFEKISSRLAEHGMDRSASQCRVKIKNLKSMYTKLKETAPHELDRMKSRIPAFHIVESVMTQKLSEIDGTAVEADDSFSNQAYIKIEEAGEAEDDYEDNYNEPDEDSNVSTNNLQDSPPFGSKSPKHVANNIRILNVVKKRKRPMFENEFQDHHSSMGHGLDRTVNLEMIMNKMNKLQNTFQESMTALQKQLRDERKFYMECEERRLKFFAELEEKRRRDERDHELKLFQLFTNMQKKSCHTDTNNIDATFKSEESKHSEDIL